MSTIFALNAGPRSIRKRVLVLTLLTFLALC